LQHVGILGDKLNLGVAHHFGDHRQTGRLARFGQIAKAFEAKTLERVR
jgi:hypothetical protein